MQAPELVPVPLLLELTPLQLQPLMTWLLLMRLLLLLRFAHAVPASEVVATRRTRCRQHRL